MLDETLLITASRAARGITAAQAAVDEAKRLVEEAKQGVETAKAGLADAKSAYDAIISEIAGTGISASKARKAVEDMLRIFAEVGIIDASAQDEAPAEPKAPRRRKSEPTAPPAEIVKAAQELATQGEPGVIIADETSEDQLVEASESPEPAAPAEEVAETPVLEAASVAATDEIDNGDVIGEIYEMIESSTKDEDIAVSETLITILNAGDWYSREHRREPLTLDLYREILNMDFVNQAAEADGCDGDMKLALEAVRTGPASAVILDWFLYVLDSIERNAPNHLGFAEFVSSAKDQGAAEEAAEAATEPMEPAAAEADITDEVIPTAEDEFTADPEDDHMVDVSDDETLAVDAALVGEEVGDIGEINFLDAPAEEDAEEKAAEPQAPAAPETPAADAAPRRFSRPSFLTKNKPTQA